MCPRLRMLDSAFTVPPRSPFPAETGVAERPKGRFDEPISAYLTVQVGRSRAYPALGEKPHANIDS